MPHHPKPFFRKPLGKWYVQIKGKQYNLGPDEPAAWEQYHALMAQKDALPDAKVITTDLVVAVLDRFLDWVKANQAPKTYSWHHDHLQTFTGSIPRGLTVAELKPYHVTQAMDAQPTWGNNTKNGFARSVQRAFRWAEKVGLIDKNPIREVEKPGRERREDFITPAEFDDVLRRFPDQEFQDLLTAAWDTGARPAELFAVEARHIDPQGSRWVFKASESKGKKKPRVVYLNPRTLDISKRLAERYPTGPLFRNANGERWDKNAVNRRFLRKKKKLGRKLCLYVIRHSFCTRLLLAGVDTITVSILMGHESPVMVSTVYSHLYKNPEHLLKALGGAPAVS